MSCPRYVPAPHERGRPARVGFVGPLLPYRGGVAQYTTELHRVLARRCRLQTISFRRLYPNCLYPGRSSMEPGREQYREPAVLYLLDCLHPGSWLAACRSFERFPVEMVILQWWTTFHAACVGSMAERLERRGIEVVLVCHNVFDHEGAWWKNALSRAVLCRRKSFLVHSSRDAGLIRKLVPDARVRLHPHPMFESFPAPAAGGRARRAPLELLFFGFVRPYKGLDVLVDAMQLLKDEDIFLTIVGEWWGSSGDLRIRAEKLPKVEIVDRYVLEEQVAEYFSRADVVVLPYRDATGTGVIPLAYHFGKPVIASRIGGIPDYVQDGASGRLVEPENAPALAAAIREFLSGAPASLEGIRSVSARMSFDSLATCLLDSAGSER